MVFLAEELRIVIVLNIVMASIMLYQFYRPGDYLSLYLQVGVLALAWMMYYPASALDRLGKKLPAEKMKAIAPIIEMSGINVSGVFLSSEGQPSAKSFSGALCREILTSEGLWKLPKSQIEGIIAHELGHLDDVKHPVLGRRAVQIAIYASVVLQMPYILRPLTSGWQFQLIWMMLIGAVVNCVGYYCLRLAECLSERRANDYAQELLGPKHLGLEHFFETKHKLLSRKDPLTRLLPKWLWILYPHADLINQVERMRQRNST